MNELKNNVQFIAYNTTLDFKTLIESNKAILKEEKELQESIFNQNKMLLMPFVLKYLHYLVDLHNSLVIEKCFIEKYFTKIRATSIEYCAPKIDLEETLHRYTKDSYFNEKGTLYECRFSIVGLDKPTIKLNISDDLDIPNSITIGTKNKYFNSIEEYFEYAVKYLCKLELK